MQLVRRTHFGLHLVLFAEFEESGKSEYYVLMAFGSVELEFVCSEVSAA